MNLEKLILPENLIARLYTAPIVSLSDSNEVDSHGKTSAIRFLGSNQKNITILVNVTDASYLSDKTFSFLTGILTACKLNVADVAIVNLHTLNDTQYQTVFSVTQPGIALLFGVSPSELGLPLNFPHFQVQPFNNIIYIASPSLDQLAADTQLKAQLWTCLKSAFRL